LRYRAYGILPASALQKIQVSVNEVVLGQGCGLEDAHHGHRDFTNGEFAAGRQFSPLRNGHSYKGSVRLTLELIPLALWQRKASSRSQFVWGHALKHNHIQAGSAIVGEDLDRCYVSHAAFFGDDSSIVFGQAAAGRAKAILLKDNQGALRFTILRQSRQTFLNGPDKTEHE
jgi:hypothetical protein